MYNESMNGEEIMQYLRKKLVPARENLPAKDLNRIVVYGSRISGIYTLSDELLKYMKKKGIPNPYVEPIRDVANIENAFFYTTPEEARKKTNQRMPRGVILLPEMEYIDMAFRVTPLTHLIVE